jgi:ADP-dependent NAD(P)H-hydrate dehydratase / NAD(P)H-hydrate epimerase
VACIQLLAGVRGGVVGSRVVLLVGSGNNGGDALWAGAMLAARGARVDALCLADRHHAEGASALTRAGGRLHRWSADAPGLEAVVRRSDLVIDGMLGIGGSGGLRADAAALADLVAGAGAIVVAVDVPSGVDADTGMVAGAVLDADVTVTFGAMKPGLVVSPGRLHSGEVRLVDIGLESIEPPTARILESLDVAAWVEEPGADAYKYRRGVVGVAAGSTAYPGAALLVTSAARHANVGMVRFLDRVDGTATSVVGRFPDVVVDGSPPAEQTRATAWACGSGFPGGHLDEVTVLAVLETPVPVVLDAGALSVVADSATVRERIADRTHRGIPTVLTPHEGEFERLRPGLLAEGRGRLAAAREAAAGLEAVIVLKGPGTIVASTDAVALDTQGTADLGTAGSGDVLTGLVAAILAGAWADGRRDGASWVEATAAAVWLHGRAGRLAAQAGPVTATDIAASVPAAVRAARFGDVS